MLYDIINQSKYPASKSFCIKDNEENRRLVDAIYV